MQVKDLDLNMREEHYFTIMLFFLKKMVFRWAVENIVGQRIEKEVRAAWKTHKAKKQAEKQGAAETQSANTQ